MNRIWFVLSVVMLVTCSGLAATADDNSSYGCETYGVATIKGTVSCGSVVGLEGVSVRLVSSSAKFFKTTTTVTDPDGSFKFEGFLPNCYVHTGRVVGEFIMQKWCDEPSELWKGQSSWRFRKMTMYEQVTLHKNLKLRCARPLPEL